MNDFAFLVLEEEEIGNVLAHLQRIVETLKNNNKFNHSCVSSYEKVFFFASSSSMSAQIVQNEIQCVFVIISKS